MITLYHGTIAYENEQGQKVNKFGWPFDLEEKGITVAPFDLIFVTPDVSEALAYASSLLAYSRPRIPGLKMAEAAVYEITLKHLSRAMQPKFTARAKERKSWGSPGTAIPRNFLTGKFVVTDMDAATRAAKEHLPLEKIIGIQYRSL